MAKVVIVGAGIVGLAIARETMRRQPGAAVVVVDKEHDIARHQSSHNSGVIHSGVYYAPGSIKASLCVQGAASMAAYCRDHGLPMVTAGKLIVAVDEAELPRLDELARRAAANGVPNVSRLDGGALRQIEPHVTGIAALHVPGTAVTDYVAVCGALKADVKAGGGRIVLGFDVDRVEGGRVVAVDGREERGDRVVCCAGLQSDRLASSKDIRIIPFRGSYFDLTREAAAWVRSMIYPVPDPRFPFLGVHFTRHVDDTVSAGPNVVLALARERYRRWAFVARDVRDVAGFRGTWRLAARYWRPGAREVAHDVSMRLFLKQARRYLPDLEAGHLTPGPIGLRAQAVDAKGRLVDDFAFRTDGTTLHVVNAPSPAATASLAIAAHVADLAGL